MSVNIKQVVEDLRDLNAGKLKLGSLRDKYRGGDSLEHSVQDTVDYIVDNKLQAFFLNQEFFGDYRDKQPFFLMKVEGGFEVSQSDRGHKNLVATHRDYKAALTDYLERLFHAIDL